MYLTALIGFGNISANYADDEKMSEWFKYASHIQVLKDHPSFEIRAVIEPKEEARINAIQNWEIPQVYENIDQLKDPDSYEVVVLAIPPKDRLNYILRFPNLKALVIEKPLAENTEEAQKIISTCNERGILGIVNFPRRYDRRILDHLKNLDLECGLIQGAFAVYGNGLHNNGSHLIDWSRMFLGEVSWVQSLSSFNSLVQGPLKDDINFPFLMGFNSGVILFSQPLNYRNYRELSLDLWGTKGRLSFIQEGLLSAFYSVADHRFSMNNKEIKNDSSLLKIMDQGFSIYNLYDELGDALKNEKVKIKSDLYNALEVMEIIKNLENSFLNNGEKLYIK